jgi:hypothetical protein
MIKTQNAWTDGPVVCQTAYNIFHQTARIFASGLLNNPHTARGRELFPQMLKFTKSGKFNALFDRYWVSELS